jgi:hypothetical protein
MYIVVLKGGGDAGGFIITDHGIIPIPPWNPDLFTKITDLHHVVQAGRVDAGIRKAAGSKARSLVREVAAAVDEQVQAVDAKLAKRGGAIAYFDEDGGWLCGTPPRKIPIPIPPKKEVSFESLGVEGFG